MEKPSRYLKTSAAECRKNPGHLHFIPTSDFEPSHLPDSVQSLLVWALIYDKRTLTVKLDVNHISDKRPRKFWPGITNKITGSGHVTGVNKSNRNRVNITIDTAAHIVFNEEEAESTVAQVYFNENYEVFKISSAELLHVDPGIDKSRIIFTIDIETFPCLATPSVRCALEHALSPIVLPNVNDTICLWQSVVARYTRITVTQLSFLFGDIKCLRNIKYVSDETRVLEIEINISDVLIYDIILIIIDLKLHLSSIINCLEDIVRRNDTNMETAKRPFIILSKEFKTDDNVVTSLTKLSLRPFIKMDTKPVRIIQNDFTTQDKEKLYHLMKCFTKSPAAMIEINKALKEYCNFDISSRCKQIMFEIPQTSVNIPARLSLGENLVFKILSPPVLEKMSLEVSLHDVVKEVALHDVGEANLPGVGEVNLPGVGEANLRVVHEENQPGVGDVQDVHLHSVHEENLHGMRDVQDVHLHSVQEENLHGMRDVQDVHPHSVQEENLHGMRDVQDVHLHSVQEENLHGMRDVQDVHLHSLQKENQPGVDVQDVHLHSVQEENQPRIGDESLNEEEDETMYDADDAHFHNGEEIYSRMTFLISCPHDMPPQITIGQLKDSHNSSSEMTYTNPSCEGSSGAPMWIIPSEPSLKDLENIHVITHSSFNSQGGYGH